MIFRKKWKIILCLNAIMLIFNLTRISINPGPEQSEETWRLQKYSQLSLDLELPKYANLPWQAELSKVCESLVDLESLRPAMKLSQGKLNVSMIIGIPTVKRQKESYLSTTLQSIFEHISKNNTVIEDILIIVMIAEYVDLEFVNNTAQTLQKEFGRYIDEGYLDIIAPSSSFYPDFSNIELSFGDGAEQVKWRSKQNLDYAYLMMYAKIRGIGLYVQLEDDVTVSFKYYQI